MLRFSAFVSFMQSLRLHRPFIRRIVLVTKGRGSIRNNYHLMERWTENEGGVAIMAYAPSLAFALRYRVLSESG